MNCDRVSLSRRRLGRFGHEDERGATAVEYGIMLAAIAAVIMSVVFTMGGQVLGLFESVKTALDAAQGS